MSDVRFKDLCIDATAGGDRVRAVAEFWGLALGQPVFLQDDGDFRLDPPPGGPAERRIWINAVPEPIGAKSRVHLDLRADDAGLAALIAAGATEQRPPERDQHWHVMHDPDGVAFCVMGPHPQAPEFRGPFELVVDAVDPSTIAAWWAERLGAETHHTDDTPWVWLTGAAGFPFMFWVFNPVPEPKSEKNRVHWDVTFDAAGPDDLARAGATLLREPDGEIDWWVYADPEGNEFCAFAPKR